jgi:N-acetyl-alpha-D-muramate 1-phosphate uridylyltransferase
MEAMILAAGLGTRLGELGRHTPKALVDVAGATALERVAQTLIKAGADRIIINVHHHADRIIDHVRARGNFGVDVVFSHETDAPLETGGGLLNAAPLFRGDAPFFLYNVDILCNADLGAMYDAHIAGAAVATLGVNRRDSTRLLLFDDDGLCGRVHGKTGERSEVRPAGPGAVTLAFAGFHVISPQFLDLITERGAFSIMDVYLRLAGAGERVLHHDVSDAQWLEIGSPERLEAARRALGATDR